MEPEKKKKAVEAAAGKMTTAVRELSESLQADVELSSMVTVLDALNAEEGPLKALADMFIKGAEWIVEFEQDVFETAADRLEDCAQYAEDTRYTIRLILNMIRPLAEGD